MVRVLSDLVSHRVRAWSWFKNLFTRKKTEVFRISYVDDTHVFIRNRSRSVAFMLRTDTRALLPSGVANLYVVATYHPRNPRKTWMMWGNSEEYF